MDRNVPLVRPEQARLPRVVLLKVGVGALLDGHHLLPLAALLLAPPPPFFERLNVRFGPSRLFQPRFLLLDMISL